MSKTPQASQMVSAWKSGMSSGQQKYRQGIQNCNVNPMALAAAKVADGTWAAACAAAAPRMVTALNAADAGFWKSQASGAGATAWAAGAAKGAPKYEKKAAMLASAAAAASSAAAAATTPLEKVRAAINAFKTAAGKPPI